MDKPAQGVGGVGGADPRLLFAEGKFWEDSKVRVLCNLLQCFC